MSLMSYMVIDDYLVNKEYISIEKVEEILGLESGTIFINSRCIYNHNGVKLYPLLEFRRLYPDYNYASVRDFLNSIGKEIMNLKNN